MSNTRLTGWTTGPLIFLSPYPLGQSLWYISYMYFMYVCCTFNSCRRNYNIARSAVASDLLELQIPLPKLVSSIRPRVQLEMENEEQKKARLPITRADTFFFNRKPAMTRLWGEINEFWVVSLGTKLLNTNMLKRRKVFKRHCANLKEQFIALVPQNLLISELCVLQKRRLTDFEAKINLQYLVALCIVSSERRDTRCLLAWDR